MNTLSTLLPLIGVIFIIAVGVAILNQHFQKNLYQQKLEQEETRNRHQQELLRSSILIQEQERKRIAQDLHDEIGALLSISRMHLVQLEEKEKAEATTSAAIQNIRSLTEKALSSMRRICHELMPVQLEAFGLIKTLHTVAAHANKDSHLTIHIDAADDLPALSWPMSLGLYRIIMELINNTLKHAGAHTIRVGLNFTGESIICMYADDGKGMPAGEKNDGLGHKSIEGRANSLGGTVTIDDPAEGFAARIVIPYTA